MEICKSLVVLDLETTGTWIERDKIIEIAMIKILPDRSRQTYHKRINPGMPIPEVVSQLTGITENDVKSAPLFKDVALSVCEFLEDADVAGFNVERFDLPMLEKEMGEAGLSWSWSSRTIYDAQKIFHIHEKRDLKAAYSFYCGKDLVNAHTALADTEATLEILMAQVAKYGLGNPSVECLKAFDYSNQPDYYGKERKFRWWNGELYPMFGKYGRKISLREMVSKDRRYCEWILGADFSDEVKNVIEDAMEGKFPNYSALESL